MTKSWWCSTMFAASFHGDLVGLEGPSDRHSILKPLDLSEHSPVNKSLFLFLSCLDNQARAVKEGTAKLL